VRPRIILPSLTLAFALAAVGCGGDDDSGTTDPTPAAPDATSATSAVPDAEGQSIGEYEDENDFVAFAEEVDEAITSGDAQFFFNNTLYGDVECGVEFPSPPESCADQPAGTSVPGIVVGVFNSQGFALDQAAYGEFMREFLTDYDTEAPNDDYGEPEPQLYAYGDFMEEFVEVPPEGSAESVHAIATSILLSGGDRYVPGEGRIALYIGVNFIDLKWQITHYHVGSSHWVDPFSEEAVEVGADEIFAFWRRWTE
jgi:hypothetical protein